MSKDFSDRMRDDYDFSKGISGKYRHFVGQVRTLNIRHPDGSVTVESIPAAIELDEDVRQYFSTSEAVNKALRGLIELMPESKKSPNSAT
ncbi:MAG: hypothetical protein R2880_10555 [Deinococcales bacterium]